MKGYQHDKSYIVIPMPDSYKRNNATVLDWFTVLRNMFFFRNQEEVFDCSLTIFNGEVCLLFNAKKSLSRDFMEFILRSLPKSVKEKNRKFFKPVQ